MSSDFVSTIFDLLNFNFSISTFYVQGQATCPNASTVLLLLNAVAFTNGREHATTR
jgi:hypothetical protein